MKLSEAILLGSIGSKQGYGKLLHDGKTCALGAAIVANGLATIQDDLFLDTSKLVAALQGLKARYPQLLDFVKCPGHNCHSTGKLDFIIGWHLNDIHRWTRPQIAAWVATIEPQEEQVVEHNGGFIEEAIQSGQVRA